MSFGELDLFQRRCRCALVVLKRGEAALAAFWLLAVRRDAMERRFMGRPAPLLIRLPSPASNCPTRDWGSSPALCALHKHPLRPPAPFVTDH